MAPKEYLGAWGTLIHEKNLKPKISCQTPFKHGKIRKSFFTNMYGRTPRLLWAVIEHPACGRWYLNILKGQWHEIFDFRFFHASVSRRYLLLKGTVSRGFRLQVFLWISFPRPYEYTIRAVSNFSKIRRDICSSRCITGVVDTGGKWKNPELEKF